LLHRPSGIVTSRVMRVFHALPQVALGAGPLQVRLDGFERPCQESNPEPDG
jgi:hypothetical protein